MTEATRGLRPADADFLDLLRQELPGDVLRAVEPRHVQEPRGRWQGRAGAVLAPRDTQQVATALRLAAAHRVAVVPLGGGTGLVGGQITEELPDPLLLSLERMNRIRALHPMENVIEVEAGAILADVQAAAATANRLFPLSLASEGSAQIGGLLATNAGGVNVLRYGNARSLCLGVEAVLPDGQILRGLSRLRKDNTGYDLRDLLIGAEGTLGVITAASLILHPQPAQVGTALYVVPSARAALQLLELAQATLGDSLSAFELIHGQGLSFLAETLPQVRLPFADIPEWSVLIDLGASGTQPAEAMLTDLFEAALARDLAQDGVIASSSSQRQALWAVREHIPLANRAIGAISSHDISVPISAIPEFIEAGNAAIAGLGDFRVNCFGHLGDGNLHYNVFPVPGRSRDDHLHQRDQIKRTVHDLVHQFQGSVSAEHGVGRLKVADLEKYGDPAKLAAMRAIKSALDPAGILNPGAVLRA